MPHPLADPPGRPTRNGPRPGPKQNEPGQGPAKAARLLPWNRADGAPCYVVGDGTGRVSRLADSVETVQLQMADDLLDHAVDILADPQVTSRQLHFLAACLAEALRDVHRIATSRGDRPTVSVAPSHQAQGGTPHPPRG